LPRNCSKLLATGPSINAIIKPLGIPANIRPLIALFFEIPKVLESYGRTRYRKRATPTIPPVTATREEISRMFLSSLYAHE
jgi:hypothetical protein